jgi:hypothetical protein
MLVENGRISLLPEIGAQFLALKNAAEGAADAEITSAFELDAQVSTLVATLEKKFSRKLNPVVTVDPALIGGVRVVVGDEVLDTSVRAKLQQMRVALVRSLTGRFFISRKLRETLLGVSMQLNPSEISELIKSRIEGLDGGAEVRNQGTVISVADGIVRIHGLSDVMQGEMLEFPGNTFGLA